MIILFNCNNSSIVIINKIKELSRYWHRGKVRRKNGILNLRLFLTYAKSKFVLVSHLQVK